MAKTEARALIARLSGQAAALRDRLILAPLLAGGRIRVRLEGLIHEFRVREPYAGWGHFRPLDGRAATLVEEAQPWERARYLELLPVLRLILLHPDPRRPAIWWALPANESDARQRFGFGGEPLPVLLCDPLDGADRFEQVCARVDGRVLWFEGPDPLADPAHAQWLREAAVVGDMPERYPPGMPGAARLALLHGAIDAAIARDRGGHAPAPDDTDEWAYAGMPAHPPLTLAGSRTLEARLRRALDRADATLHGFSAVPGRNGEPETLVVEWSERGQRRRNRSLLGRDLSVVSSGICLSGRDRDFDLTSLVSVMGDSHER